MICGSLVHLFEKLEPQRNQYRMRLIPFTQEFLECRINAIRDILRSWRDIACLFRLPLAILSVLLSPILTFVFYLDPEPVDVEKTLEAIYDIILRRSEGNFFLDWLFRLPLAILSLPFSPMMTLILYLAPCPANAERKLEGVSSFFSSVRVSILLILRCGLQPRQSFRSRFMPEMKKFMDSHIMAIREIGRASCRERVSPYV